MEIVHLVGFYPPHLGGQEHVVQRLATSQADRHQVTVYTSDLGARHAPRVERHQGRGGALRVVRNRAAHLLNAPVPPALPAQLLRHTPRPDVLHVHTGQALLAELAALVSRVRGIPYVLHQHLMLRPSTPAGRVLLPAYLRFPYTWAARRADRVICLTQAMSTEVVKAFGVDPSRIEVVPNGVDHAGFDGLDGPRNRDELLFVGRLAVQKNLGALLEALAALRRRGRDPRLRVIGDGDQAAMLRARAAELGLGAVTFEGRRPVSEVAAALARATALVMPSTHEGLPLVLLEAMAAGTPVVAFALPEIVEVGGDAVLAADPRVPDSLADSLELVLGDEGLRRRMSEAGRQRVREYSWPAVRDQVERVYARLLSGEGVRG